MSEASPSTAKGAAAAVPLDEVMLAMDVVDTLRHQRALVEAELGEEERERALIDRIKAIYSSQGIEVPGEVVAEGVAALQQDRFTYDPPERTLATRLAEIYVERGKWTKRAVITAAIAIGLWLSIAFPLSMHERAQISAFTDRVGAQASHLEQLDRERAELRGELDSMLSDVALPAAAPILGEAGRLLDAAGSRLDQLRQAMAGGPDPETYPDNEERLDAIVRRRGEGFAAAVSLLGAVRGRLRSVESLGGISLQVRRALRRLEGVEVESSAAARLASLRSRVESALEAGDADGAQRELGQLKALVDQLDSSYELRIVSRGSERSGVWRHPNDNRSGRNYYLIVEPVAPDGSVVTLPITSEEDNRTRPVRRFGVRVPESVYQRVKADKQDNGIIDDAVVGAKRRGALQPEYRVETAGGMITDW